MPLDKNSFTQLQSLITLALKEDLGRGDATEVFFDVLPGSWQLRARQSGVFCGDFVAEELFRQAAINVECKRLIKDGETFTAGDVLQEFRGDSSLLTVERILLNMIQHLTAVATETARWVNKIRHHRAQIYDTRKTTPAYRYLEKRAVLCGGGENHRMALDDAIMIKDNHHARKNYPKGKELTLWIEGIKKQSKIPVIVEVENREDCLAVAEAGPQVILLDNMTVSDMKACVSALKDSSVALEASGGIRFENLEDVAESGVHRISVGALTQNPPRVDLGLDSV
jgi:nicotinate-nucleotide pyrophosphorylase (carboxylating)